VRRQVAAVAWWQVAASLCYYGVFAATPLLSDHFGLTRFTVGVLVTTLTVGYTLALFPSGALVDALGEKPVMVGGLLALGGGAIGVSLAPDRPLLFVAAVVLGLAYATAMPATNRAVVANTTPDDRGFAMGVKQVGVTAGSGLAAVLVVSVGPALGAWNTGFWLVAGVAIASTALFVVAYTGERGHGRTELPDVRRLLDIPGYPRLAVTGFLLGASIFTTVGYLTLYLTDTGTAAALAGLAFAGMQVTGGVGRVVAGAIADRIPGDAAAANARVLAGQTLLGALALAALATNPGTATTLVLVGIIGLTVLGYTGLYYSVMTALVPEDAVGTATAGGQTALNAGALVAPPAFGYLATHASYEASWLVLAVITATGALVGGSIARGR